MNEELPSYFNENEGMALKRGELYRSIVENNPDLITRWDKGLKLIFANPAFETRTGVPNTSLYGKNISEMGQPGNIALPWMENLRNALETGETGEHFNSFPQPGAVVHFHLLLLPERDGDGNVESVLAIARDITHIKRTVEQHTDGVSDAVNNDGDHRKAGQEITSGKKAEQRIKEYAHFIGQVMETTPDFIYIMDLSTKQLIYANRQIAADLGYTRDQVEAMANPIFDIMIEEDIPLMNEHLKKMRAVKGDHEILEIEYKLKNADGTISWFCDRSSVFKRNSRNVAIEKIGITQNVTEAKLKEERILTNLDILAQAEEIAEMGSWEYDIASKELKWSEGMYRLFNLPRGKKVTPETYFDYTPEAEYLVVSALVDNIQADFVPFEQMITLLPEGSERKIVKIKAIVIRDKKNNPVRIVGVDLDVTNQLKAAGKIGELNGILMLKNRDLEMLNHELKTFNTVTSRDYKETIQTLYTNLEYIVSKDARSLSDTSKANIRRAQAAIQKMKLLTEDINSYLRLYDLGINKTLIDPNSIITDILSKMKGKFEQAGATIEVSSLSSLYADPLLFSLLITHLFDNALKFRKLVGPTNIRVRYSQADEINAVEVAIKNMPYTIISVFDNGVGFPEEDAEKLFDLFFRLENRGIYKGSGIGLAVCKKIMSMHGGFIIAESMQSVGATFSCYFPAAYQKTDETLM